MNRFSAVSVLTVLALAGVASAQSFTVSHGATDCFSLSSIDPLPTPSDGLLTHLGSPPLRVYDELGVDKGFADTFSGLPSGIVSASLDIVVKPAGFGHNDSFNIRFANASGVLVGPSYGQYFGPGNGNTTWLMQPATATWWGFNYSDVCGYTITMDLANMPGTGANLLPTINGLGFFDVWMQDDTAIDSMTLRYQVPAPGSAALLALGGLVAARRRRR